MKLITCDFCEKAIMDYTRTELHVSLVQPEHFQMQHNGPVRYPEQKYPLKTFDLCGQCVSGFKEQAARITVNVDPPLPPADLEAARKLTH
jgi:hypothetical protein